MKQKLGLGAGAWGCTLFLAFGCGGSSFEEGSNDAGGSTATAGRASGGQSAAGSSANAGESSGGSANGGSATAGSSSAGTPSGGTASGGASTGGTGSGGVPSMSCDQDTDCMDCAYPTAPLTAEDCYCATCATTPTTKSACAANQATYDKVCANVHRPCPAIACVLPPQPACKSHICVAK